MNDMSFEQMMEIIKVGHDQTMEMLDKVIELKKLERESRENTTTTIADVVKLVDPGERGPELAGD